MYMYNTLATHSIFFSGIENNPINLPLETSNQK